MNNKKLGLIISIMVVILLAVGSVFYFSNIKNSEEGKNGSVVTTPKKYPPSSSTPSASSNSEEIIKNDKVDEQKKGELPKDEVIQEFEKLTDHKDLVGYSEQEINDAIKFVSEYSAIALTNTYFLGGQWEKDNYSIENLKTMMAPYYSSKLLDTLDEAESKNGEDFANAIMPYVMYLGNNGAVKPSKYCADDAKDYENCTLTPLKYSEISYYATEPKDGINYIVLKFNVVYDLAVTIVDGDKDAKSTVSYSYTLMLDKVSGSTDSETKYEIIEYDTSYELSKVVEVHDN